MRHISFDSKYLDQLQVKPNSFYRSPGKEDQHDVVQECSTDPTELFDIGQINKTTDEVKDVQTSKRNAQIYKDLTMHTCSQFPKK